MDEVAIIADFEGVGFDFAKGIYDYLCSRGKRDFLVSLIDIEKTEFRDKEFKVRIKENIRRKKCFFIHDSNKNPAIWLTELLFALEALRFSSPSEINVILPYTKFARQERKDASRVGVNAKALADIISLYATRGMTVDLHASQMQEYFRIPFDNLYSFPSLITHLEKNHPEFLDNLVVVSPDLGGGKRAEAFVKRLVRKGYSADIALGHKTREKDNEVAKNLIIGDVEGKDCLILDDMIDTGGTIVKTEEVLREKGARKIFAYGTHGIFTEGLEKFDKLDKLITSDTMKNMGAMNLEVVSLVNLFGEAIYRTIIGESLSDLFNGSKEKEI